MPTSETLLIFTESILVAILNAKTALFFMVAANPRLVRIQEYVSGSILVGLGLYVAQTERAN